jgi:chaperonin GroEL (HSP60 family)
VEDAAAITAWIADWVVDLAAPCYGPGGLGKLIDTGGAPRFLRSGASALRDAGIVHPDVQPFVELGAAVQTHAGDQATGALLLAARLVRFGVRAMDAGAPAAAMTEGYALAERQALAALRSMSQPDPNGDGLRSVVPDNPELAALVLGGARQLATQHGNLPLDSVDVRSEPGETAAWLEGIALEPQFAPRTPPSGEVRVLLLTEDWKVGTFKEGFAYKMTSRHATPAWLAEEENLRLGALRHIMQLGAGAIVCMREIDPDVAERASKQGVLVWNDAPITVIERLERSTGARRVSKLLHAAAGDMGAGRLTRRERRRGGWLLAGAGPSATLVMPAENAAMSERAKDDGERLLRTVGAHFADPSAVPGGGRWARDVARNLRKASDAAPGKAPLALRAAADAFDALADDLVRNLGLDPLRQPLAKDAGGVLDVAPAVRAAVAGAFEVAIQLLRIDDRLTKRVSDASYLRGSGVPTAPVGGDVPPLM